VLIPDPCPGSPPFHIAGAVAVRMARILIAHPAASIRQLLEQVVEGLGHEAATSPDGPTGLACDVLVLDPGWPDAYRLALKLRARRPGLPVVCVSSRSRSKFAAQLASSAFLVLPVTLGELESALRDAVAEAS
jgi:CheY-like chemotaxis protein